MASCVTRKITNSAGFTRLYGPDATLPSRAFFSEVSPSLFAHTFRLADAIVEVVRSCHARRITTDTSVSAFGLATMPTFIG